MDISPAKLKAFMEIAPDNQKDRGVTLGDFSVSFEDLLSKSGSRLGDGMNTLAGRAGIGVVKERAEQQAPAEKPKFERREDAPRAEQHDDQGHEERAERKDVQESSPSDKREHHEEAPRDRGGERESSSARDDDSAPAAEAPKKQSNEGNEGNEQGSAENSSQNAQSNAPAENVNEAQAAADAGQAEQVLASLLASAQNSGIAGQTAGQSAGSGAENAQVENAVEGLSKAIASVGGQKSAESGNNGALQNNTVNPNALAHGQNKEQGPEQVQAQPQAKADAAANASSMAQQQAASLSKMVGEGNRVQVNVNVTEESSTILSQPGSNLGSSAILSEEGMKQQQQGGQQNPLNHGAAQMNQMAAQNAAAQNQAQQVSAQTQAVQAASVDAKGPVQGVQAASNSGPQVQATGGDSAVSGGANATSETSQTAKNSATQTANTQQAHLPKHAVIDQVSVQISKAIKAGLDKINIQLRPENMGRVDVRLEVATDGRTMAVVLADNKDTLDLLQRDSRELMRALQDAGLDLDNEGLSFGLRGQNGQAEDSENASRGAPVDEGDELADVSDEGELTEDPLAAFYEDGARSDGRIDIRA